MPAWAGQVTLVSSEGTQFVVDEPVARRGQGHSLAVSDMIVLQHSMCSWDSSRRGSVCTQAMP